MTEPEPSAGAWKPTFPAIRRLDQYWYLAERWLCGLVFLFMALLVFGSVLSEAFGTRREWTDVVILFSICFLGTRTRAVKKGEKAWGYPLSLVIAVVATGAIIGGVFLAIEVLEGRSIMIQKLALVMMIWVALLGASMATYERSHLSLEMGEKIWPAKLLPFVKSVGHGVTSAFCFGALLLSIDLVASQRHLGVKIEDTPWLPLWQAFLVVPYAFGSMAVRFLAQAVTTGTNKAEPVEERLPT